MSVVNCVTLTRPEMVAGVVAMSGRLPAQVLGREPDRGALAGRPVLVTHGLYDQVLPVESERAARGYLQTLLVVPTYRKYLTAREVSAESLRDVAACLSGFLDAGRTSAPASAWNAPGGEE